ncbi:ATP-dependent nuclease [Paenibacillus sp. FSL R5-0345]|uniref:ATP-dependent nuclease n=1 Tax=Paenibacillus sp. FSL R5-0345 TaxID=1536770 RepID=UPI0009DCD232|nr:ATP-dependent endonuclease [Paenibacillus sp. FSL R5-0345]
MYIDKVKIKNFRLLNEVELTLEETTTLIVGRNNSGKTSFTEIFRRLLSDNTAKFNLEDFSIPIQEDFWNAFMLLKEDKEDNEIRQTLPYIEITLTLIYDIETDNLGALGDFIIDLDVSSTQVIINIKYQLKDGKISSLFDNLEYTGDPKKIVQEKKAFFREIKERVPQYFAAYVHAIDPKDSTNQKLLDISVFRSLIQTGFINAQRGLDDTTHKTSDVLGKVVERMLDIAKKDNSLPDDNNTASLLEDAVKEIQSKLDTDFNEHLNKLLPALSLFGYPGLNNVPLHTETILDVKRLLENHTKVHYPGMNGINLPETYNGLGSRNLIYILFQLFEFFKTYKSNKIAPNFHLVFIEEPEAHLHPQMQEVFIRKITEIINDFSQRFNSGVPWPIQFIITTHSTHIANEAPFEAIRYFLSNKSRGIYTRVKDLKVGFSGETHKEDKEFLHKYLTLTRCDLFFADKVILIEGPTERILMPKIIQKIDKNKTPEESLSSKYLTVIEVGGAYAHHFFSFLDFLELQSLIITDIDSVKADNGSYRKKCIVAEGTYTSNTCLKRWFSNDNISPADLLIKSKQEKIHRLIRIAYQVPDGTEPGSQEMVAALEEAAATNSADAPQKTDVVDILEYQTLPCGRSFEDAFMLANKDLFENLVGTTSLEIAKAAWDEAKKVDKTNFALDYAINKTDWDVPRYIKEGLFWLAENLEENLIDAPIEIPCAEVLTNA